MYAGVGSTTKEKTRKKENYVTEAPETRPHLNTVDGSLSLHLVRLEDSDDIKSQKAFVGLRPKTTCEITPRGRTALRNYLENMKSLIEYLDLPGSKDVTSS